jgi:predicted nicotinamide N-methyase
VPSWGPGRAPLTPRRLDADKVDGMASSSRAFVLRQTVLRPVPGLEQVSLHLADEVLPLWRAVQVETNDPDATLPYWAFAWAGGLAIGRYLLEHPEVVAGRRVFDLASGSGLCAIVAKRAGAAVAIGADIDPLAAAAIELNARANRQRVAVLRRDVLDDEPPEADVILAGDCWYEEGLAARVLPWLRRASDRGIDVLVGDPGRRYLPVEKLVELASYEVRTTTELEDLERKQGHVFALRPVSRRT